MGKRAVSPSVKQPHSVHKTDRHTRAARSALQDIAVFYKAVQDEMKRLRECEAQGLPVNREIYKHMEHVSKAYDFAVNTFKDFNLNHTHNALIAFGDAVKDMIAMIHRSRSA